MNTLKELLAKVKILFEQENFISKPEELYTPIEYTLALGGKRIRPVMLMAANEMFGGNADEVSHAAIGIETFHNFTLLHDDLMDHSPIRRGQPTVYCKWNENTAILSGDAMLALSWRYFLKQPHPQLQNILTTFNETAMEVFEGQQYDMNFETQSSVKIADYWEMIRLKTAVLLAGALKIGALYANADSTDIEHLYNFGIHIGLAFQVQDDLLDAYGDASVFGKHIGTDIKDNKKTYLFLKALEIGNPHQQNTLRNLFAKTDSDSAGKIAQVLAIYRDLNIKGAVEQAIAEEFDKAQVEMGAISVNSEQKSTIIELTKTLFGRER